MLRKIQVTLLALVLTLLGISPGYSQTPQLFVSDSRGGIIRYNGNTGSYIGQFIAHGSNGMSDPIGLVFGPDGNLYVASTGNSSILRFNGTTGAFINTFVPSGTASMNGVYGLVFGPNGNLYAASAYRDAIYQFDGSTGAFIAANGRPLPHPTQYPHGIAFGLDENIYAATSNSDVMRFNGSTMAYMDLFASSATISSDSGIAYGPDGNLYVCSYYTGTVERFNGATGAFMDTFVTSHSGGLAKPIGIVFGPDLNLYVSSYGSSQILKFNGTTGAFMSVFAADSSMQYPVYLTFYPATVFPLRVSATPSVIGGSLNLPFRIMLNAPTSVSTNVTLQSSNEAVIPSTTLTIPAGKTVITFPVPTALVDSTKSVTLTASINGASKSTTVSVRPLTIASLTVAPRGVIGGTNAQGTITLENPIPTDSLVTLSSDNPTVAAPAVNSVVIPANTTTFNFGITTSAVATNSSALFKATYNGTVRSARLAVFAPSFSGLSLIPKTISGGSTSQGRINLTGPAPTGGLNLSLTSSNTAVANVPASVTVPEGQSSALFDITTTDGADDATPSISATLGSTVRSNTLTVLGARPYRLTISPSTVIGGTNTTGTVTLNRTSAVDVTIALASNTPSAASVPASVVVPAGQLSATFPITTSAVSVDTQLSISASANGVTRNFTLVVKAPILIRITLSPAVVQGGNNVTATVTFSGPVAADTVVNITTTNTAATVPATATIPAGASSVTFQITTAMVIAVTRGTVTATIGARSASAALSITP